MHVDRVLMYKSAITYWLVGILHKFSKYGMMILSSLHSIKTYLDNQILEAKLNEIEHNELFRIKHICSDKIKV